MTKKEIETRVLRLFVHAQMAPSEIDELMHLPHGRARIIITEFWAQDRSMFAEVFGGEEA